jgi:hypothetical protein
LHLAAIATSSLLVHYDLQIVAKHPCSQFVAPLEDQMECNFTVSVEIYHHIETFTYESIIVPYPNPSIILFHATFHVLSLCSLSVIRDGLTVSINV